MPKTHPDEKTLEKFGRGKLTRRENMKVSWHLFNCAACRQELEELVPAGENLLGDLFTGLKPQDVADNPSYDRAFSYGQSTLEVRGEARDRDRSRAPKLYTELMRHPVSRQQALIKRTWRFKNYVFAEYLVEQAKIEVFEDPSRAEDLGRLALVVAEQLEGSHYGDLLVNDLKTRAWAEIANSLRVQTDLRAADEALASAREQFEQGTGDILLEARLITIEGSLRREQRRFDEADEMLQRAYSIYNEADEDHLVGRTLLLMSKLEAEKGEPEKALARLDEAEPLIDAERDPAMLLSLESNRVSCLHTAGRAVEAKKLLPGLRNLTAEHGGQMDEIRLRWLSAVIERDLGNLKEAEKELAAVSSGFADRRIAYEAALASLDLAAVFAQQGRNGEVKELAEEMLPIFRSRDVHREATAALLVFHKAAMAESVTVKMVHDIAAFLRDARLDRNLVYKGA